MIKDGIFKIIGIPLLGLTIPWLAGLLCCPVPEMTAGLITWLYFSLATWVIWQGIVSLVSRLRVQRQVSAPFPRKISVLILATMGWAFAAGVLSAWLWQRSAGTQQGSTSLLGCGWLYAALALVLALLYECMFLSKERELELKIVNQLDLERVQAEISALKAELDPHFIFNALTTVSHLVGEAPATARQFTQKLAQVYKYFLLNKDRELIPLSEELRFIEDYFFLLQIRYDHSVRLHLHVPGTHDSIMMAPCSLQLLVENAIKHNRFSEQEPLNIHIRLHGNHVTVENELRRHTHAVESTRIGLTHLKHHYRLLGRRDVVVQENENRFIVQVPLIKP